MIVFVYLFEFPFNGAVFVYLFELLLELDQCGCVCLFVCLFQLLVELDQGGCVYLNF